MSSLTSKVPRLRLTGARGAPLAAGAVVGVAMFALLAEPAFAAEAGEAGSKLAGILQKWAAGLLFACAGFAGITALMRQDLGQAVVIFLIVVFVGAFVFAGPEMVGFIRSVWQDVLGVGGTAPECKPGRPC